jgi:hypothetical protein
VLHDPIGERLLEADVTARFFGFQPFVPQDLVKLCLKLFVERGVLYEIVPVGNIGGHMGVGLLSVTNI